MQIFYNPYPASIVGIFPAFFPSAVCHLAWKSNFGEKPIQISGWSRGVATTESRILIVSLNCNRNRFNTNLITKFFQAFNQTRVKSRKSLCSTPGIKLARNNPCCSSSAIHCESLMSVLRPGTALIWRALTNITSKLPSKMLNTGRQYSPVLSARYMSAIVTCQPIRKF